jgi:hypothetical protein
MSILKPTWKHNYSQAEAFSRICHPGLIESIGHKPQTQFEALMVKIKDELLKSKLTRKGRNKR